MSTATEDEHRRERELGFCSQEPDQLPADRAVLIIGSLPGVLEVALIDKSKLKVHYDLRHTSLEEIVEQLANAGLHLGGGLMERVSRALCFYTEDVQRQNLGLEPRYRAAFTRKIFIDRYQRINHRCRDARPDIWREYH